MRSSSDIDQLGVTFFDRVPDHDHGHGEPSRCSRPAWHALPAELGVHHNYSPPDNLEVRSHKIAHLGLYVDQSAAMLGTRSVPQTST